MTEDEINMRKAFMKYCLMRQVEKLPLEQKMQVGTFEFLRNNCLGNEMTQEEKDSLAEIGRKRIEKFRSTANTDKTKE
jgi:hypothetical protein